MRKHARTHARTNIYALTYTCTQTHTHRKTYESAEAEFIRAKMELHKKTEMKERLTEHLCVIIQENEIRKAKKLAELMAKLEIDSGEYLEMARSSSVENR